MLFQLQKAVDSKLLTSAGQSIGKVMIFLIVLKV